MNGLRLDFYSKDGCSLCEEARPMVVAAASRHNFLFTEHDIRSSMALFMRYRHRVPVLEIDGQVAMTLRFDEAAVEQALSTAAKRERP
ncbi:MAG: glutaredoxin family protein [Myxococcaceae bacterium]|nr:glutaredoxin family protein [Myxococcaceae bacterium]